MRLFSRVQKAVALGERTSDVAIDGCGLLSGGQVRRLGFSSFPNAGTPFRFPLSRRCSRRPPPPLEFWRSFLGERFCKSNFSGSPSREGTSETLGLLAALSAFPLRGGERVALQRGAFFGQAQTLALKEKALADARARGGEKPCVEAFSASLRAAVEQAPPPAIFLAVSGFCFKRAWVKLRFLNLRQTSALASALWHLMPLLPRRGSPAQEAALWQINIVVLTQSRRRRLQRSSTTLEPAGDPVSQCTSTDLKEQGTFSGGSFEDSFKELFQKAVFPGPCQGAGAALFCAAIQRAASLLRSKKRFVHAAALASLAFNAASASSLFSRLADSLSAAAAEGSLCVVASASRESAALLDNADFALACRECLPSAKASDLVLLLHALARCSGRWRRQVRRPTSVIAEETLKPSVFLSLSFAGKFYRHASSPGGVCASQIADAVAPLLSDQLFYLRVQQRLLLVHCLNTLRLCEEPVSHSEASDAHELQSAQSHWRQVALSLFPSVLQHLKSEDSTFRCIYTACAFFAQR